MTDPHRTSALSHQQFHILLALTDEDRHGYGIILEVAERTGGAVRLGTGPLYTAIGRLAATGLIEETSRRDRDDERRRYLPADDGRARGPPGRRVAVGGARDPGAPQGHPIRHRERPRLMPSTRAASFARRAYAILLRLHPASRAGYGSQMASTFDEVIDRAAARGSLAVLTTLVTESAGLLASRGANSRLLPPAPPRPPGTPLMRNITQDVRFALRTFKRRPGFTAAVIATLALGIGANAAIFSVANAVLLQRLPFKDPSRLVMVWQDAAAMGFPRNDSTPADYFDVAASVPALESTGAVTYVSFNLIGTGEPELVNGLQATSSLFQTLGVQPLARPRVARRRRHARQPPRRADVLALEAPVQRRSRHHRAHGQHERLSVHRDRRDAGRVRDPRSGGADPDAARILRGPEAGSRQPFHRRRRAPPAGRDAHARQRAVEARWPSD